MDRTPTEQTVDSFEVVRRDPVGQVRDDFARVISAITVKSDPARDIHIPLDLQEVIATHLFSQYPVFITGGTGAGKSTVSKNLEKEACAHGITTKYIELDVVAHTIYTSLTDLTYQNARQDIARVFGKEVLSAEGWIDRKSLRKKLLIEGTDDLDPAKLETLDGIMFPAIESRYRELIKGFKWIIFIDGITKEGSDFSRLAHHNTLLVDAGLPDRIERLSQRYVNKGDPISEKYIRSMIGAQPKKKKLQSILSKRIKSENNGSIRLLDNSGKGPDSRKEFFRLLNQIDRHGELRSIYVLHALGMQGDIREYSIYLRGVYNNDGWYPHTWTRITKSLGRLFEMAIELNLSDEDIAVKGRAILRMNMHMK